MTILRVAWEQCLATETGLVVNPNSGQTTTASTWTAAGSQLIQLLCRLVAAAASSRTSQLMWEAEAKGFVYSTLWCFSDLYLD